MRQAISKLGYVSNGSVVRISRKFYWVSNGVEARIITGADGQWFFIYEVLAKTGRLSKQLKQARTFETVFSVPSKVK